MTSPVPIVDYLVLDEVGAHLRAHQCRNCGARYFDRRNACAACSHADFGDVQVAREGTVTAFTIVNKAAAGVPVPFVAAVVDCAGTTVRANLIDVDPDPRVVRIGMQVELATYSLGTDRAGVEAIGFGFRPGRSER
jgi:uncharacterized OB-fold protein